HGRACSGCSYPRGDGGCREGNGTGAGAARRCQKVSGETPRGAGRGAGCLSIVAETGRAGISSDAFPEPARQRQQQQSAKPGPARSTRVEANRNPVRDAASSHATAKRRTARTTSGVEPLERTGPAPAEPQRTNQRTPDRTAGSEVGPGA